MYQLDGFGFPETYINPRHISYLGPIEVFEREHDGDAYTAFVVVIDNVEREFRLSHKVVDYHYEADSRLQELRRFLLDLAEGDG